MFNSCIARRITKLFCKIVGHYHPEDDGMYLAGLSYGRFRRCGTRIKKVNYDKWEEVKEDDQIRKYNYKET